MTLTADDFQMIRHAAQRGEVVVHTDGVATHAELVAWKPTRRGRRTHTARVRFLSGRTLTVDTSRIALP